MRSPTATTPLAACLLATCLLATCLLASCVRVDAAFDTGLMPTLGLPGLAGNATTATGPGSNPDGEGVISGRVDVPAIKPIVGEVSFPEAELQTQALMKDVAKNATVSLINATSNQTLATTLTDANGAFLLDVKSIPATALIYYLEGVKGLNNNAVGSDVVRVRTFITYDFGAQMWKSLTSSVAGDKLRLNATTTAITVVTSLRQGSPTAIDPAILIGKLRVTDGNPPTEQFLDSGTGIAQSELTQMRTLVTTSLTADADPFDSILIQGGQYKLRAYVAAANEPVHVSFISPTVTSPGDLIGINGYGFLTPPGTKVTFSPGVDAEIVAVTPVLLTVRVPEGAESGPVVVQTGSATSSAVIGINQPISGGFNP